MRRFSANYIYTCTGKPIKNGIVGVDDDGLIVEIIDPAGKETELAKTEFHNGVIVPGFVNAHCHTELSHLKGLIPRHEGLAVFVSRIRDYRLAGLKPDVNHITNSIQEMYRQGTVAVADICNTPHSLMAKEQSPIHFISLFEVFGMEPNKAEQIFGQAKNYFTKPQIKMSDKNVLTPHSTYTLSEKLWDLIAKEIVDNPIVSIHFEESKDERDFTSERKGGIVKNYSSWNLPINSAPQGTPLEIVKRYIPKKSKILFVHNTFLNNDEALELSNYFSNAFFVLCPESNLYIESKLPDVLMLNNLGLSILIGTDSLASSPSLCMLEQMKIILKSFPTISFSQILSWATINGAKALGYDDTIGSIELGKKPGLNLLSPFDFTNMSPASECRVRKLA